MSGNIEPRIDGFQHPVIISFEEQEQDAVLDTSHAYSLQIARLAERAKDDMLLKCHVGVRKQLSGEWFRISLPTFKQCSDCGRLFPYRDLEPIDEDTADPLLTEWFQTAADPEMCVRTCHNTESIERFLKCAEDRIFTDRDTARAIHTTSLERMKFFTQFFAHIKEANPSNGTECGFGEHYNCNYLLKYPPVNDFDSDREDPTYALAETLETA